MYITLLWASTALIVTKDTVFFVLGAAINDLPYTLLALISSISRCAYSKFSTYNTKGIVLVLDDCSTYNKNIWEMY